MARLALIAAVADNGVIGRDNALPWHLPGDLAHFRRVTMGRPILMGRRTFESIGRALPGRTNIVISRDPAFAARDVQTANSLAQALALGQNIARCDGVDEILVIGGAQIYREALPGARRLYLTEIHAAVEGDAYMPPIDRGQWCETSRERRAAGEGNPYDYSFVVYDRLP